MSIRAFNQYIDMYLQEHPSISQNDNTIKSIIASQEEANKAEGYRTLLLENLYQTNESIMVKKHPYIANQSTLPHSHDYFELIYLSRGECSQVINGQVQNMRPGDICLLTPNDKHSISISAPDDLLFNILIRPSLFQESFLCLIAGNDIISNFFLSSLFTMAEKNHYLYFPRSESSGSSNLIQSLIIEYLEKRMCYAKSTECYLALLFTELVRTHKDLIDKESSHNMGDTKLSQILSYINQHKVNVTLSSVAEHFHYHPNYLSMQIKKYTDKSFSEFLQDAKLQEASYYLRETNLSIEEIYQLLGYYDRSYFNRSFKKYFSLTPSDYRTEFHFYP